MRVPLLVAPLACVLALSLPGCGESSQREGRLLTERESASLLRFVDGAEAAAEGGECNRARQRAREGEDRAGRLSRRVHRELRDNLVDWFDHLEARVADECERDEPERTPTPDATEEPTPEPTEEATPEPTPTETASPTPTATASPEPTPDTGGAQEPPEGEGQGDG